MIDKTADWKESWPLLFWGLLIVLPVIFFFQPDNKVYFRGLLIEFVDENRTMLRVKEFYRNDDKYVFIPGSTIPAVEYVKFINDERRFGIAYKFEDIYYLDEINELCDMNDYCQLKDYITERKLLGKTLKLKDIPKGIMIYERK